MAAIFKSSLQNLSPLPPRLKVKSTDFYGNHTLLIAYQSVWTGPCNKPFQLTYSPINSGVTSSANQSCLRFYFFSRNAFLSFCMCKLI